jgi:hypothetical protein
MYSPRSKTKYRHTFRIKNINLTERIEKQKENWHEHILRMATDRLPKVLLNYKPRGYRNIGRPMARWEDALLKSETGLRPISLKQKKKKKKKKKVLQELRTEKSGSVINKL